MTDLSTPPTPATPTKTYTVRGIPVELLGRMWPYAKPFIKRALDHATGEFTVDDLHQFAQRSQLQLWLVHDGTQVCGAATTELVRFPSRSRLRVLTVAGREFDLWALELDRKLSEWALTYGCDGIEAYVRRGFVPKLRAGGYKLRSCMVYRPLQQGT